MKGATRNVTQQTPVFTEGTTVFPQGKAAATVPASRGWLGRLFRRRTARPADQDELRRLVQRLYLDIGDRPTRYSILFTCPGPADVAVSGALRLARCLAEDPDRRVLLVDTCLRRRDLSGRLGDERAPGLLDYLDGAQRPWTGLVRPSSDKGVFYLPAGRAERDVHSLLKDDGANRLASLLEEAKQEYGFALLIAPSLLMSSYSLVFPSLVDCVLMAVRPGETRRQDAVACTKVLETCRARRVGLVVAER